MITFNIFAEIKMALDQAVIFAEPIQYSYDNISVVIKNNKDDHKPILDVKIVIIRNSFEEAKFITENELIRIIDTLSWENTLKIKSFNINSIEYIGENGKKNFIATVQTMPLNLRVGSASIYSKETVKIISNKLASPINPFFQDVLMMWREALTEESRIVQFLLCYRILEHLNGGNRKRADLYIRSEDKSIPLKKGLHGEDISLYTYLRDNVHAKTPGFPFKDIDKSLGGIRYMVFNAIKKFFPTETI